MLYYKKTLLLMLGLIGANLSQAQVQLEVELISFSSRTTESTVHINWTVAQEYQSEHTDQAPVRGIN